MKIREKVYLREEDVLPFLHTHKDDKIRVESIDEFGKYHITYEHDYTAPEFNMKLLADIRNSTTIYHLNCEELNAIDYAIGAIKTLADMGVLK